MALVGLYTCRHEHVPYITNYRIINKVHEMTGKESLIDKRLTNNDRTDIVDFSDSRSILDLFTYWSYTGRTGLNRP